jgi:AcrR family transcriptional regulator
MDRQGHPTQQRGRGRPHGRGPLWTHVDRTRRGQQSPLSRDEIVRAAIEIADAEGADAISMRRIAQKLHAGAMSLYWHVSSKKELLTLVIDEVFGEIDLPARPTGNWRADLRLTATETRRVYLRHPWAVSLLSAQTPDSPNLFRNAEFSIAALDHLGLDAQTSISIFWAVHVFVEGSLGHELVMTEDAWHQEFEPVFAQIAATGRYPHLAQMFQELRNIDTARQFEFGLDSLLDGIAARIEAELQ